MKPIIVLKVGTATILGEDLLPDESVLQMLCQQLAELHKKYRVILVSSGSVGYGRRFLKKYTGTKSERRAAASIGNSILIEKYVKYFNPYHVHISQALLERWHFSERRSFLALRETFEQLWENDIIPIVNENDVVSDVELRFSDNDELATLLAVGFSAQKLLLGTSVEGVWDQNKKVMKKIDNFNSEIFSFAKGGSTLGLGGMISKLNCAKKATNLGTEVVIFDARVPGNVLLAELGKTGTVCPAQVCDISAHKKWMATGSLVSGKIFVDDGAIKALKAQKSLLAVGVQLIEGEFGAGEFLEILSEETKEPLGIGRARISSDDLIGALAKEFVKGLIVAHVDEIVLF
jgi:glutamate 5-kinase